MLDTIKPYYESERVKLYCGDAALVLPQIGEVDACIIDPPYGINGGSGTKGRLRKDRHNYDSFQDTPEYIRNVCVPIVTQCVEKATAVAMTPGSLCFTYYPAPASFGTFWQPATCGMQKWGRADSQPIFYYGRDPRLGKTIQFCSYRLTEPPSCDEHPCAKPMKAWKWLINRISLEGQTVLDPMCGSATTLIACIETGRKAIGIEISESYCAIAARRIQEAEAQLQLDFTEAAR